MRDFLAQFAELGGSAPRDFSRFDLWAGDRVPGRRPCNAWAYQGWIFEGYDRGLIWREGDDLLVAALCDDPADWDGHRWGRLVRFPPLSPDPAMGGAVNVRASQVLFAEGDSVARLQVLGPVQSFDDLAPLIPSDVDVELVGIWLTDASYLEHKGARRVPSWREWTHGVDPSLLDATGRVRPQRSIGRYLKPKGTRTYFLRNIAAPSSTHAADIENAMIRDLPGSGEQESVSVGGQASEVFLFTTEAPEPGLLTWDPGEYRVQLDIPAAGVDVAFGPLNIDTGIGHFGRVGAVPDTDIETHQPAQGPASGAGLHLFVYNGSWTVPAAQQSDRYEVLIAAQRISGHGNQEIFIRYSVDCFADGPWSGGGAGPAQGILEEAVAVSQLAAYDVEVGGAVMPFDVEIV